MPTSNDSSDIEDLKTAVFGCNEQQVPGLKREVYEIKMSLVGDGKILGLVQKVGVMWRLHVWLLCVFSGAAGSGLTLLIQKFAHP